MIEKTLTKQKSRPPAGRCTFRIMGKPEKLDMGSFTKRRWMLLPDLEGFNDPFEYDLVPWEAKEFLIAVGGKETPDGYVEWDDDRVDGKEFTADVVYVEQPKINQKTNKPYTHLVLKNFEQEIAF